MGPSPRLVLLAPPCALGKGFRSCPGCTKPGSEMCSMKERWVPRPRALEDHHDKRQRQRRPWVGTSSIGGESEHRRPREGRAGVSVPRTLPGHETPSLADLLTGRGRQFGVSWLRGSTPNASMKTFSLESHIQISDGSRRKRRISNLHIGEEDTTETKGRAEMQRSAPVLRRCSLSARVFTTPTL